MSHQDKITVYSPEPELRAPLKLFSNMAKDLLNSRELAWCLFIRNISAKYRQTMIGYVWAILPPILTSAIWIFLNNQKIFSFQTSEVPYPLYVLTGTIIWQIFVGAIHTPIQVVKESSPMIAKINFPREALILAALLEIIFNMLIQLIFLTCVFLFFSVSPNVYSLLALVGLLTIVMMGMMVGIILTPIAILYGDIQQGLPIILQPLFYLTPIVYPTPESGLGTALATLNPVSPVIQFIREILITGQLVYFGPSIIISCFTFSLILLAWLFYRVAIPRLVERIAA